MKHLLVSLLYLTLLLSSACTNSDQYLYETDSDSIEVWAYMASSFDSNTTQLKSDTISPGDSLLFISKVNPSKSLRSQGYYWTIDGTLFANEYSFRNTVNEPGFHQIAFIYVDYFGDTLSDTLSITVATPPQLDSLHFIPASGIQQIKPTEVLNFAWNANDPDSMWNMYYHFTMQEASCNDAPCATVVDTILHKPIFSYMKGFSPLQKYSWNVQAFNELGQYSAEALQGYFYVTGFDGKGALLGHIRTSSRTRAQPYSVVLQSSDAEDISITSDSIFSIKPLACGQYRLLVSSVNYADYSTDTLSIDIADGTILDLDSIVLKDTIPPIIRSLTDRDTIGPLDSFDFFVKDGGGKITNLWVKLDGKITNDYIWTEDTLSITIPSLATTWSYRILSITALDQSDNRFAKSFYISPRATLPEESHE